MEKSQTSFDILKEQDLLCVENWEMRWGRKMNHKRERARFSDSLRFLQVLPTGERKKMIVDYGSGHGHHASVLKVLGWNVICVDYLKPAHPELDWVHPHDFSAGEGKWQADALWSHHCLEHISNPIELLIQWQKSLKPNGELFLTVPPVEPFMVSGHITAYTPALLLYHLAISGFDCSDSRFCVEKFNALGGAHLRAWVKKSLQYHPDCYTSAVTIASLAEKNLFPPEVAAKIKETGEAFSAYDLICRWPEKYAPVSVYEQYRDVVDILGERGKIKKEIELLKKEAANQQTQIENYKELILKIKTSKWHKLGRKIKCAIPLK